MRIEVAGSVGRIGVRVRALPAGLLPGERKNDVSTHSREPFDLRWTGSTLRLPATCRPGGSSVSAEAGGLALLRCALPARPRWRRAVAIAEAWRPDMRVTVVVSQEAF